MAHRNHDHSHHEHRHDHGATGNIGVAFALNLLFTIAEVIGGLWTNSVAILSDALHDLGDSFTLGLSWYLDRKSSKGRDRRYSYGYRRFSVLGALVSSMVLLAGSLFVLARAVPRLIHPQTPHARGMLVFALVGIAVNGAAALRLRGATSLNAKVVALHLLEDVLGWVGVLVVSVVLLVKPIAILDPILSLVITGYVLYNLAANLRHALSVFLQAVPHGADPSVAEERIAAIPGVHSVHHTHSWSLDGERHVFTAHVVVSPSATWADAARIKQAAKNALRTLDYHHATIEIEVEGETCRAEL